MSWEATAWAKKTRGHKSYGTKLLLMVLADYHDTERGYAYPGQQTLSRDCEMPVRTVQWCLGWVQRVGFVTILQKGNQHQLTHYQLNFGVLDVSDIAGAQVRQPTMESEDVAQPDAPVAPAPLHAPAISGPASIAPAPSTRNGEHEHPQPATSEPAMAERASEQEPKEELKGIRRRPKWFEVISSDQRWPTDRNIEKTLDLIERSFDGVNLEVEATKCLMWLSSSKKGKKITDVPRCFLNWLTKAKQDLGPANGAEMSRADVIARDAERYGG